MFIKKKSWMAEKSSKIIFFINFSLYSQKNIKTLTIASKPDKLFIFDPFDEKSEAK